jgi:predicted nucleic acid-binding protein
VTPPIRYLADASAIIRLNEPEVAAVLGPQIRAGDVATCGMTELALLSLLRDPAVYQEVRAYRMAAFPWFPTTDDDLRRALEVQARLVEAGQPTVSWPSLIVAAVAERHGAMVLHSERSFTAIATITNQCVGSVIA